jgi:hypothetical protein
LITGDDSLQSIVANGGTTIKANFHRTCGRDDIQNVRDELFHQFGSLGVLIHLSRRIHTKRLMHQRYLGDGNGRNSVDKCLSVSATRSSVCVIGSSITVPHILCIRAGASLREGGGCVSFF